MRNLLDKSSKLEEIRNKLELIIQKNEEEVGSGKSVGEIEGELLSSLLEMGKLLLCERIE